MNRWTKVNKRRGAAGDDRPGRATSAYKERIERAFAVAKKSRIQSADVRRAVDVEGWFLRNGNVVKKDGL